MISSAQNDLVILTTSPAGLGHIRVMQAMKLGLPIEVPCEILGVRDERMQLLHRVTSINPYLRKLMEFIQNNPVVEGGFTRWYRLVLQYHPQAMYEQVIGLVQRSKANCERVIIVCTHFGAAHALASVKQRLASELNKQVVLAVIVTDDSPQQLWAVAQADYIFVPSESTRAALEVTLSLLQPDTCPILCVVPYPVSPILTKRLSAEDLAYRQMQLSPTNHDCLRIMVPISGAAVHLSFYMDIMKAMHRLLPVQVVIVAKQRASTRTFLEWAAGNDNWITVKADSDDSVVVELYEKAYQEEVIALEITKPSEQTFKVLVTPKQVGGALLMLNDPVGRQEDDNVLFLNRHHLMPNLAEQADLSNLSESSEPARELMIEAKTWRAIALPEDPEQAAMHIFTLKQRGILAAMGNFNGYPPGHEELDDDGVKKIWETLLQ